MPYLLRTFLFFLLISSLSCERIDLDDLDNNNKDSIGNNDVIEDENDSTDSIDSTYTDSTISTSKLIVSQALQITEKDYYDIEGYMVGYIKGNSINTGAQFSLPDKVNTNFLLADSPTETNPEKCLPVKLEKDGRFATRNELNLFDHPEHLGQRFQIYGFISTYFKRNGVVEILHHQKSTEENSNPEQKDSTNKSTPDISKDAPIVIDGRSCTTLL